MKIITFEEFKDQFAKPVAIEKVRENILKGDNATEEGADYTINEMLQFEYRKYLRNNILKLVPSTSKVLRSSTQVFDFNDPPVDPVLLSDIMKETMSINNGIGLSANQIGFPYSVFIMGNPKDTKEIVTIFNPKVVDSWGDEVTYQEGCISFPDLFIEIKRPANIRARYADITGDIDTQEFDTIYSRVFQHEYDHLNGIVFTEKAKRFHLERAKKNQRIIKRRRKSHAA